MLAVEIDQPQHLLVIRYSWSVAPAETERGLGEIQSALSKLQSGFRLLADLTELKLMDVACAPFIEKAMVACNEKGISTVVRVIPDPARDIGMKIMSLFHYGANVRVLTCENM